MNDMPKCSYTIRKESESGPEVHYATIGDSVFHVWHCDGENLGILVQNCHVEDGQGNRILIIDQNGCGVDHYVMATPEYNSRLSMAFQPPSSCPTLEERLAKAKKLRDVPQTGIKEIYKSVGIYSSTENSVTSDTLSQMREVHPPASKPDEEVKKNTTLGYIYYGYGFDSHRQRRDILINQSELNRKPRFSTSKGYPEIDLVGELRVLDSPEDVKYYESLHK
uniref:ZP domain-containing protein n=1 Tax=Heterorhabditis bacteriophora TaxID=37862 RepID=A0A1I7WWC1_HETBA